MYRARKKTDGEIKKVSDLFEKYKNTLVPPERTVVKTFCDVVAEVVGITIKTSLVKYSPTTRILSILQGGPLKSEIKLHKEEVLAHLKGRLGENRAPKEIV